MQSLWSWNYEFVVFIHPDQTIGLILMNLIENHLVVNMLHYINPESQSFISVFGQQKPTALRLNTTASLFESE